MVDRICLLCRLGRCCDWFWVHLWLLVGLVAVAIPTPTMVVEMVEPLVLSTLPAAATMLFLMACFAQEAGLTALQRLLLP